MNPPSSPRAQSLKDWQWSQQSKKEQDIGLRDGQTYLYLLSCQVLCAPKDVALGNPFTAQLVNLDHSAKSDKPHQSVGRQQT